MSTPTAPGGRLTHALNSPEWATTLFPALQAEARRAAPFTRAAGHDEADLITEGVLCVDRTLASYDSSKGVPLTTWFAKVVVRRHFITLGRRGRFPPPSARFREPGCEDPGQLRVMVREVIGRLLLNDPQGKDKAEAFTLYHMEGYRLRELAARYGKSLSTVHSWIKDANADFRRLWT